MSSVFHPIGDPEPEVSWYKGDAKIKAKRSDKRIQMTWDMKTDLNHLVIADAKAEDRGEYKLKAENSHGHIEYSVTVKVGKEVVPTEEKEVVSVSAEAVETVESKPAEEPIPKDTSVTEIKEEEITKEEVKPAEKVPELEQKSEVTATVSESVETSTTVVETTTTEEKAVVEEAAVEEVEATGAPVMEVAPKPSVVDVGETITISCKFTGIFTSLKFTIKFLITFLLKCLPGFLIKVFQ